MLSPLSYSRTWGRTFALAVSIAMVFLIRNSNLIVSLMALPLVLRSSEKGIPYSKRLSVAALCSWVLVMPHFLYLRPGSGHWLFIPYVQRGGGFANWKHPEFSAVLFLSGFRPPFTAGGSGGFGLLDLSFDVNEMEHGGSVSSGLTACGMRPMVTMRNRPFGKNGDRCVESACGMVFAGPDVRGVCGQGT